MADWKDKLRELKRTIAEGSSGPGHDARPQPAAQQPPVRQPERRYVCLGLDFGTSSTKAVIRLMHMRLARPVPFEGLGQAGQPYLAPTRLWVNGQGALGLSKQGTGNWVQELKVRLMEKPWDSVPEYSQARAADLAAGYVALVLRHIHQWFEREVRQTLGQIEVIWSMNVGIPARDFDAEVIRTAFYSVARAGWHLALEDGPINVQHAADVINAARKPGFSPKGIDAAYINIVPEVAAGVTTYVRSPGSLEGPHLFVDVGATTLDSSVFLLGRGPDGFKYTFLDADVDSDGGALRLHKYRASELARLALEKFEASEPLTPIPETARECIPGDEEIDLVDQAFLEKCVTRICGGLVRAKIKAEADLTVMNDGGLPRAGAADPGAIRVLLSGGGMRLPLYRDAVSHTGARIVPGGGLGVTMKRLMTVPMPQPPDLQADNLDFNIWERLAIAYGLSFGFDDIGRFIPPSSVPVLPLPRRGGDGSQFISKDQV